jgi:hypothetical protein
MTAIDWAGLVQALILLITAVTLAINLWNQGQIAKHSAKIDMLAAGIQKQLNGKIDKQYPP